MIQSIPTLDEAFDFYMSKRAELTPNQKRITYKFEGQKFFRFGDAWHRKAVASDHVLVIPDTLNEVLIERGGYIMGKL